MREIKFRGKRIDTVELVYGSLLTCNNPYVKAGIQTWIFPEDIKPQDITPDGENSKGIMVDPETVGEYTDLRDKNGKEIYEGDILVIDTISNRNRLVSFKDGCLWISLKVDGVVKAMYPMHEFKSNELEIIGNIHENPELL